MIALQNTATSKRSEARSLESYRQSLQDRKNRLLSEGQLFEENLRNCEAEKAEARREKEETEKALETARTRLSEARTTLGNLNSEMNALAKENEDLRIRAGQAGARKKTIEEMENNYEGYNGAVRFIMKNAASGIKGVVADLMKVCLLYTSPSPRD